MGAVAGVVSIVSAVAGLIGQKKQKAQAKRAAKEERKQRDLANRQQAIERQRNIRRAVAQQRVLRAQVMNANLSQGMSNSSALGQMSAISGDLASSIGSSNTQFATASGIAASQNRQAGYLQAAQGNFFTDIAQFGQVFTNPSTNRAFGNFLGIGAGKAATPAAGA